LPYRILNPHLEELAQTGCAIDSQGGVGVRGIPAVTLAAVALHLPQCGASAQMVDPVFANSFESGLVSFGPSVALALYGESDRPTAGTSLRVTLSEPAQQRTFVPIVSNDPSVIAISSGGVVVPAGQSVAAVFVSGLSVDFMTSSSAPVTLWATYGNTVVAIPSRAATFSTSPASAPARRATPPEMRHGTIPTTDSFPGRGQGLHRSSGTRFHSRWARRSTARSGSIRARCRPVSACRK
jgi:hypothetical protein